MTKRLITAALLVALSASSLQGAEPAKTVAIRAGRLLDVRTGELRANVTILVRDGRIADVGPNLAIPAGAEAIDLSKATVLPSLIDVHTHLTFDARFHGYRALGISVPRAALYGAANAKKTLEAGFTTVRDVGSDGYADIALRDAINAGELPGPRILAAGQSLGITGGHCDDNLLPPEFNFRDAGVADGPWGVRVKVRENVKYGADVIKFCATGGVLSKGDQPGTSEYTFEEMQAIVEEAHKLGRRVAAHAHGAEGIKTAIRAGVDSIEHGSLIDEEGIALARARGTFVAVNLYTSAFILERGPEFGILPESIEKARGIARHRPDNFARMVRAGVRLPFGTDAGVFPHGENARQFALMVANGMTPLGAIQSATLLAAELLGLEKEIGALEPGMRADLIAVSGNPLENVRLLEEVRFVMKDGRVAKNTF